MWFRTSGFILAGDHQTPEFSKPVNNNNNLDSKRTSHWTEFVQFFIPQIKFKHHFDTLSLFKNLYYNHVETYLYNKIVYNLLHRLKSGLRYKDSNITVFLAREDQIRDRYTRIMMIVDYCLRTHYLHVDDSLYRNFFNYSRSHLQKTLYDPLWKQYREYSAEDMFYSAGR
ncbi:hypothetical protein WDU94_006838 [Cyamophila willieti]